MLNFLCAFLPKDTLYPAALSTSGSKRKQELFKSMKQQEERLYGEYQILLLWEEGKLKTESAFRSYVRCYFAEEFQCSFFLSCYP